jgi:hypothetical protein
MHKKKNISSREYLQHLEHKSKDANTLVKKRLCVINKDAYYKIDYYPDIEGQPMLLLMQTTSDKLEEQIAFPPFFEIYREVTDEKQYQAINMAMKDYKMDETDR